MPEIAGLYVAIDPTACRGRDPVSVARAALAGGARVLQWRDKTRDKGDQLADARAIYMACIEHDALFIVNDHADLALVIGGSTPPARGSIGLHLGQHDLPIEAVRPLLPAHYAVGVSTNNPDEARAAAAAGASYVAVGDIFGTTTKEGTRAASPAVLAAVKAAVGVPVVGIGGINRSNVGLVMAAGGDAAAVISAVCGADDPEAAARELVAAIGLTNAGHTA
jgi:thiamine-phosphate diphosphorylase